MTQPHWSINARKKEKLVSSIGVIVAVIAITAAIALPVWWVAMMLWNAIAAGVFGAPELTYWQTAGAMILLGLLTSGFRAVVNKGD